jgi:hypothetical protein
MPLTFFLFRWTEQGEEDIEIEPVDATCFLRALAYLSGRYHFEFPRIVDTLDGYAADFILLGILATLAIDTWSFALIVRDETARDVALADLRALPPDFFDAPE